MMEPTDAATVVNLILGAYPTQRQKMNREDIAAMLVTYTAGLGDLNVELVTQAVKRLMRTSEWIPTIAAIRDAAGVLVHGTQRTGAEAWGSVLKAIGAYGSHRTPGVEFTFDDPITIRVVSALGWSHLCRSEDLTPDRARFIDAYEQIAKNERTEAKASNALASKAFSPEDLPVAFGRTPAPLQIAAPDERSAMLREQIASVRENGPKELGKFIADLMPVGHGG